jgi:hypothetical protein
MLGRLDSATIEVKVARVLEGGAADRWRRRGRGCIRRQWRSKVGVVGGSDGLRARADRPRGQERWILRWTGSNQSGTAAQRWGISVAHEALTRQGLTVTVGGLDESGNRAARSGDSIGRRRDRRRWGRRMATTGRWQRGQPACSGRRR